MVMAGGVSRPWTVWWYKEVKLRGGFDGERWW